MPNRPDSPSNLLLPWRAGDRITAVRLDAMRAQTERLSSPDLSTNALPGERHRFEAAQFQITVVGADYVVGVCYSGRRAFVDDENLVPPITDTPITESAGTELVYIAKPWLLRRSSFDQNQTTPPPARAGITYTYTTDSEREATNGPEKETQHLTPSYEVGDVIYAIRTRGNGDAVAEIAQAPNPTRRVHLRYVDLNLDGRCWAAEAGAAGGTVP